MHSISGITKEILSTTVCILNEPFIKEGIKNIAGAVTFAFGVIELYDMYHVFNGRNISTEANTHQPEWKQVAYKVTIMSAKIALLLSVTTSRPGALVISHVAGRIFSTAQLNGVFGPNTTYAVNPRHPRHIISIAAVILASPAFAQTTYKGVIWMYKYIRQLDQQPQNNSTGLTDIQVRWMTLFNMISSRPTLHIGNQFARFVIKTIL